MVAVPNRGQGDNAAITTSQRPKRFSLLRCALCCECESSAPATPIAAPFQNSDKSTNGFSQSTATAAFNPNTKPSAQPLSTHPLVFVLAKKHYINMCADQSDSLCSGSGSSSRPPKFLVSRGVSNETSGGSVFRETTLTKNFRHEARRLQESQESDNPPVIIFYSSLFFKLQNANGILYLIIFCSFLKTKMQKIKLFLPMVAIFLFSKNNLNTENNKVAGARVVQVFQAGLLRRRTQFVFHIIDLIRSKTNCENFKILIIIYIFKK